MKKVVKFLMTLALCLPMCFLLNAVEVKAEGGYRLDLQGADRNHIVSFGIPQESAEEEYQITKLVLLFDGEILTTYGIPVANGVWNISDYTGQSGTYTVEMYVGENKVASDSENITVYRVSVCHDTVQEGLSGNFSGFSFYKDTVSASEIVRAYEKRYYPNHKVKDGKVYDDIDLTVELGDSVELDESTPRVVYLLFDWASNASSSSSPSSSVSSSAKSDVAPPPTEEEIAAWKAAEVEAKIKAEEAIPVTDFVSASAVNAIPAEVKGTTTEAVFNVSKITTTRGFVAAVDKIVKANPENKTITFYSNKPFAFSASSLEALTNTNKEFVYMFSHGGHLYKVTIPAGAKVDLEGQKFAGPLFIGAQLGTSVLVK